jgi:TRAP-type mannitol/chloroaromatic compound transport system substrate-binding protein
MSAPSVNPKRRRILKASLALAGAPAVIGTARAQSSITWKVQSHWPKASGSYKDSLEVLATELERRTNGRFKFQMFGAGEIAKGPEVYNVVRRGVVEMGTISPAYILGEAQCMGIAYGVPGTLREPWEMEHLMKNLGVEGLVNQELEPKGVILRCEKIYPTELVVKKPIKSLDDFKSLKLSSAGTMLDYLAGAGASPTTIQGPELYQALSTGVVDGAHWGAAIGALSMKLWEVAKFHMKPALGMSADAFIINKAALEKLPDDLRLKLMALVEERFFRRSAEYSHKEAIALTKGRQSWGVEVMPFPPAVQARFAEASTAILATAHDKGEPARTGGEALVGLMKDRGYA